jgi:hypothetical protein
VTSRVSSAHLPRHPSRSGIEYCSN